MSLKFETKSPLDFYHIITININLVHRDHFHFLFFQRNQKGASIYENEAVISFMGAIVKKIRS